MVMWTESLDQNWNHGGVNKTEKAHKVVHNYDTRSGQMYFIRSFRQLEFKKRIF